MKKIIKKLKTESVFTIATILAIVSSLIVLPKAEYIDTHVLMLLFNLMLVVELYRKEKFLDAVAVNFLKKYRDQRMLSGVLIMLVFFFSMLLTNDVALITFVPLTIIIGKKGNFSTLKTVVLETVAANIGSSLTPMGNPQNLYLFTKYSIPVKEFFLATSGIAVGGLVALLLINLTLPGWELSFQLKAVPFRKNANVVGATLIFLMVLGGIFMDIPIGFTTFMGIFYIFFNKQGKILKKIDWILLATFVSFFIFVGNLSNIPYVMEKMSALLSEEKWVYIYSILFSQIISNVPAALLISQFTGSWKPLLLGVNIGGMGTLVASLASLISYKIYINEYPEEKRTYLKEFLILNFILLTGMGILIYIFI